MLKQVLLLFHIPLEKLLRCNGLIERREVQGPDHLDSDDHTFFGQYHLCSVQEREGEEGRGGRKGIKKGDEERGFSVKVSGLS